jgi:16S rRNA (guanine966-N2)-methyltransferase
MPHPRGRAAKGANRVRIVGGEWRRRLVSFPDAEGLRPTPDRVRETLFNWLGQDLTGERALDLFAGSGVLGFEALSRGASECVLVEASGDVLRALRENARVLGAARARIVRADALEFLRAPQGGPFDVVFVDPPFSSGLAERVLERLPPHLAVDARVYVESPAPIDLPGWTALRHGRAGAVHFQLIKRDGHDESGVSGNV